MYSKIKSIEYYLPKYTETLKTLKKDNPEWDVKKIYKATGVNKRFIAKEEDIIQMAEKSCKKLIKNNNIKDIDFLILVTQSQETGIPSSSCILHKKLDLNKNCMSFDINQGCSGFVYSLAVATSLIKNKIAKRGIIVCSEKYSKYIRKNDKTCRPIFSDGSASILIEGSKKDRINSFILGTNGAGHQNLMVPSKDIVLENNKIKKGNLYMNGSAVFLFTLSTVQKCFNEVLRKSKIRKDDIDYVIFHQASRLVLDNLVRKLDLKKAKVINNLGNVGNTVSASIPIALKTLMNKKKNFKNSTILLLGFGVGYSWGGCIVKC